MIKSCISWIIIINQHRGTKQITHQSACGWDITLLRCCFQWKPLNWSCCSRGMKKRLWMKNFWVAVFLVLFICLFSFGSSGSLLLNSGSLHRQWVEVTLHCSAEASQRGGFSLQSTGSRRAGSSRGSARAPQLRRAASRATFLIGGNNAWSGELVLILTTGWIFKSKIILARISDDCSTHTAGQILSTRKLATIVLNRQGTLSSANFPRKPCLGG